MQLLCLTENDPANALPGLDLLPHLLVAAPDGAVVDPSVVRSVLEVREYLGPWIAEKAAAISATMR